MSNPFLKALNNRIQNRYSEDSIGMSMTEWLSANTTLRGKAFSTGDYPFQTRILDDMHPNMDVIKCSQVGLTECQIRKTLGFLVRHRGTSAMFTFPDEDMFKSNSKTRIKPLVSREKVFNTEVDADAARSIDIMQFGESFLYITGCTESDATSRPVDFLANDEVDISDQKILALFHSRLQNSDYRINQRFSTPTFPSFGIDLSFQASDQQLYLCRCEACNHWNWPEFNRRFVCVPGLPDDIEELHLINQEIASELVLSDAYVRCEKCQRALNLSDPSLRQWVPRYPGRTNSRGYHVTPFSAGRLDPAYIISQLIKYQRNEYIRGWYNTVLGLPYSDGNIRLDEEVLRKCFTNHPLGIEVSSDDAVCVGIDMGQTCHLTMRKGSHFFRFVSVHVDNIIGYVKQLCENYKVVGGAVDRHPYEPTAQAIFEASKGKIVPVEYRGTKEVNLVLDPFKELSHVQVDRTAMLDGIANAIRKGKVEFSGYGAHRETIIAHFRDMNRDESPETPATWVKMTGNDHYFHSAGFCWIADKIKDVEREQSKDDPRTQTMFSSVDLKEGKQGLMGLHNKRFANPLLTRV